MTIVPHTGYGDIILGSSRSQIIGQLGQPNERWIESFAHGSDVEYFEYVSPDVILGFDAVDGDRLGTITTRETKALLNDLKVVGREIKDVLSENQSLELDDDLEELGMDYVSKSEDLSLWVSDGKVTNVTIFPAWIDEDTPRWPQ